jgi:hypothetical protein
MKDGISILRPDEVAARTASVESHVNLKNEAVSRENED